MTLDVPLEYLFKICTDYEKLTNYLPAQINSIKIIEIKNDQVITEESIKFSTLVKNTMQQRSIHQQVSPNKLFTEIISGPAKGTTINFTLKNSDNGTEVNIYIELKLSLKAKFLQPMIKLWYKRIIKGVFLRINREFTKEEKYI